MDPTEVEIAVKLNILLVKLDNMIQSFDTPNQIMKSSVLASKQPTTDKKTPMSRPLPPTFPHRSRNLTPTWNDVKEKNTKIDIKNKYPKKKIFKNKTTFRCNKC